MLALSRNHKHHKLTVPHNDEVSGIWTLSTMVISFQALEVISARTRNLLNRLILLSNQAAKYLFVLRTKGHGMK